MKSSAFSRFAAAACALAFVATTQAEDWAPNLTLTSAWHDNATNAKPEADRISGLQVAADVVASDEYSIGKYDVLQPTAHLAAEWWPKFHGLTESGAGARLAWRHTLGTDMFAPVLSLEGGADEIIARESTREGTRMSLLATVRKRLTDQARLALTQEFADHAARAAVYDRKWAETALEFGRDLTDVSRLTLRVSYRHGDVVTHASEPRADFEALASNRLDIESFGRPMTAYSIEADTLAARVGFIRAIDKDSALILGYEIRRTERDTLRFYNQIGSLSLVHQF